MKFAVFSAAIMIGIYFLTVSSVVKVTHPNVFLVLGGMLNLGHLLAMAGIFAVVGRAVLPDVPLKVHVENVLYATALLPILGFFAQPLLDAQLRAYLADSQQFSSDLRGALDTFMGSSTTAQFCNWLIFFGYLLFGRLIYVGLRVTSAVSAWLAARVVVPAMILLFLYQSLVMMPSTQQFVHAMTRP